VENYADKGAELMLIGNKTDLKDNKVVDTEVARVIIQLFSFML